MPPKTNAQSSRTAAQAHIQPLKAIKTKKYKMNKKFKLEKAAFVFATFFIAYASLYAQKNQKDTCVVFGLEGFFVRDSSHETVYLDFNPRETYFKGCLVEGKIDTFAKHDKDRRCKITQTYQFEAFGKNFLRIFNSKIDDTFSVKKLDCSGITLRKIDKKHNNRVIEYAFKRDDKNPCNGNCLEFCPPTPPQNSWLGESFIFYWRIYRIPFAVYFGTFFLLFWYRSTPGFLLNVLKIWLPLTTILSTLFYSSQVGLLVKEYVLHFCNYTPKDYTQFTLFDLGFDRDGNTIYKNSLSFWFYIFMVYSPLTLSTASWLTWKLYVKKFNFQNSIFSALGNTAFGSISAILIIITFIAGAGFFVGSFSGWLVARPFNWWLLILSGISFWYFFKYQIFRPYFEITDLNRKGFWGLIQTIFDGFRP